MKKLYANGSQWGDGYGYAHCLYCFNNSFTGFHKCTSFFDLLNRITFVSRFVVPNDKQKKNIFKPYYIT